jgi:hypothetical protein
MNPLPYGPYFAAKSNPHASQASLPASRRMNIDVVDQEIRRLQVQLMIYQTARNAYATALQQALPKDQ